MKILFAASEASPFMMTGGLGEVAGALPKALSENEENDVRLVLPLYSGIGQAHRKNMRDLGHINVPLAWRNQYCGVFSCKQGRVTCYFVDNEYYFKRETIYGHYDDGERFAFFSKAVLEILRLVDFQPDIIHANDWQTALVPIYLNLFFKKDPFYQDMKTLFTIHNIQYQGVFGKEVLGDVFGIPQECCSLLEFNDCANLMKGAVICSDFVNTVSPTYAMEIQDGYYAHGLDWILRDASYKLKGILNGIDTQSYDPETDPFILARYNARDLLGKKRDKEDLQRAFGLPERPEVPLIGMVTRLVSHKGLDLISFVMDELMGRDVQLVLLGTGDFTYEDYFYKKAREYPRSFSIRIQFDPALSRKVYAGSDMFLMPSKSEPCGLAQMIAMRYGTVPIVRQTGGLKDSVPDYGDPAGRGFTFKTYNAHDMLGAIDRAIGLYQEKAGWEELIRRDMGQDFSWDASAKEYEGLYKQITGGRK